MSWTLTAISAVGFVTVAVYAAVATLGWRHSDLRCGPEITVLHIAVGISALAYSIQLGFDSVAAQALWWKISFAASTAVPVLWLIFVAQYVSHSQWVTPGRVGLLAVEPLLVAFAVATNGSHGLVWAIPPGATAVAGSGLDAVLGPLYLAHIVLAYVAVGLGMGLIFLVGLRWSLVYWKQVAVLLVAPVPPFLTNLAFTAGVSPIPGVDLTPFVFTFTGVVLVLGLYYFDLLERVPIARRQALQAMGDGLVVLNSDRTVVDADDIARRVLDPAPEPGQPIERAFPDCSFDQLHGTTIADTNAFAYDVRVSELQDERSDEIGYAVALRDVTSRRRYEQRLEVANRVLRHNLRNDMNVVRGYADLVASGSTEETARAAESILNRTDDLLTVSDKARKVSKLDDSHARTPTTHDVTELVDSVVHQARRIYPDAAIRFDGAARAEAELTAAGALATAVEELLELLVSQADRDDLLVRVAVEADDDVVVRIESNGAGIPAVERETLAAGSETPLQHAEGLGLWLAYWCVIENGGTLDFADGPEWDDAAGVVADSAAEGDRSPVDATAQSTDGGRHADSTGADSGGASVVRLTFPRTAD